MGIQTSGLNETRRGELKFGPFAPQKDLNWAKSTLEHKDTLQPHQFDVVWMCMCIAKLNYGQIGHFWLKD
jgi:hypothetical protein